MFRKADIRLDELMWPLPGAALLNPGNARPVEEGRRWWAQSARHQSLLARGDRRAFSGARAMGNGLFEARFKPGDARIFEITVKVPGCSKICFGKVGDGDHEVTEESGWSQHLGGPAHDRAGRRAHEREKVTDKEAFREAGGHGRVAGRQTQVRAGDPRLRGPARGRTGLPSQRPICETMTLCYRVGGQDSC